MPIIKLLPAFKNYLWGGTRLRDKFSKKTDLNPVAESWELSTHPDGESIVNSGEYSGLKFSEYLKKVGKKALGTNARKFKEFPILIKFIDAKQSLSIQVHPSDEYALRVEGEYGKTEMWYIVDCNENASIYYGVKEEISKETFKAAIEEGTVCDFLNEVKVAKGDVYFIPAGTIHAVGAGIIICEIQQNSNTTYRVFDFQRRDKDGSLRDLHVDKAIEVSILTPSKINGVGVIQETVSTGVRKAELATSKYFTCHSLDIRNNYTIKIDDTSFTSLVFLEGEGFVSSGGANLSFASGDSFFVPANNGNVSIQGTCKLIMTTV